jgi:uncharacterized protein (DUF849 family)
MLLKAALNGTRTRAEHPAIPLMPEQQAHEAKAAVAAGAGAIHVHVRDATGTESLAPEDLGRTLEAIRAACPGIPVGVSTGAWIVPDLSPRLALIRAWETLPDFASVNLHKGGGSRHGLGAWTWRFVELAVRRHYDTRAGFEDTLTLPDGSRAQDNAALVAAARRIIAGVAEPPTPSAWPRPKGRAQPAGLPARRSHGEGLAARTERQPERPTPGTRATPGDLSPHLARAGEGLHQGMR